MSWADLLIDMNVLFTVPALVTAAVLAWHAARSALRLYRSATASDRTGPAAAMSYGRQWSGASKLHRI